MKKCLTVLAAVLVLSAAALGAAAAWLGAAGDDVTLETTDLRGDRRLAQGLRVDTSVFNYNGICWNTAYTVGDDASLIRRDSFVRQLRFPDTSRTVLNLALAYGGLTVFTMVHDAVPVNEGPNWNDVWLDVASRTGAGTTHEEKVQMAEYYTELPVGVSLTVPQGVYYSEEVTDALSEAAQKAFHVRTPEQMPYRIAVTRDGRGEITQVETEALSTNSMNDDLVLPTAAVTTADHTVYFALTDTDALEASDAVGLYRFSCAVDEEKQLTGVDREFELVFPLDRGVQVQELRLSADERYLRLFTKENGQLTLTVLNAGTYELVQKTVVMEQTAPLAGVFDGDGFLALICGGMAEGPNTFALLTYTADGICRNEFHGDLSYAMEGAMAKNDSFGSLVSLGEENSSSIALDYAQGRLAMLVAGSDGVSVAVYDAQGLRYLGYDRLNLIGRACTGERLYPGKVKAEWRI